MAFWLWHRDESENDSNVPYESSVYISRSEDGGGMFLRKDNTHLPDDTSYYLEDHNSYKFTQPWTPQIFNYVLYTNCSNYDENFKTFLSERHLKNS